MSQRCIHILREASALSVQLQWAIPEPLMVGRTSSTGSHAFLLLTCRLKSLSALTFNKMKNLILIFSALFISLIAYAQELDTPVQAPDSYSFENVDFSINKSRASNSDDHWTCTSTIANCFDENLVGETAWILASDGTTKLNITLSYNGDDSRYTIVNHAVSFYWYDGDDIFNDDAKELISDTDRFVGSYTSTNSEKDATVTITSPSNFPYTTNAYYSFYVVIKVKFKNGGIASVAKNIGISRPGVIILHGLNDTSLSFQPLMNYLINSDTYISSQVLTKDYSASNTSSFYTNTHENQVVRIGLFELSNNLFDAGIACSKFDMIGHSMGGILERLYNQEVDNEHTNKLITLNTPHFGAPLGNLYSDIVPILSYVPNPKVQLIVGILKGGLELFCNSDHNKVAVTDLAYNSPAIKNLNSSSASRLNGIPVYAIGTYLDSYDFEPNDYATVGNISDEYAFLLAHIFKNDIPRNPYNYLFENVWGDGVVSITSQKGGLSEFSSMFNGTWGNAFHCNSPKWSVTENEIRLLLLSDANEYNFSMTGFKTESSYNIPPAKSVSANSDSEYLTDFADPKASSYIKINVIEVDNENYTHQVKLSSSDDMATTMVYSILSEDKMVADYDKNIFNFDMKGFAGEKTIYAIGRTNYNALVMDSITINLKDYSGISETHVDNESFTYSIKGDCLLINLPDSTYSLELYNISGTLMRRFSYNENNIYSLEGLHGVIIAHIRSNNINNSFKIIH